MNSIYFVIYENRPEHFPFYRITWSSLLAFVNPDQVKLVVPSVNSSPQMLADIPKAIEVRPTTMPLVGIHLGTSADLVKWATSLEGSKDDLVLFLDSRDMVFQRDPFEDIGGHNLVASGEGVNHDRSPFNSHDHVHGVGSYIPAGLHEDISKWPVVCFGVVGGRRWAARGALMGAWLMGSTFVRGGTDQGAWNYMWNKHLRYDDGSWMCDPNTSDWCLSGHHAGDIRPEPFLRDGQIICAATGRPYAMIHQWERTQWRNHIFSRWDARRLTIITPVSRPGNLVRIRESILASLQGYPHWRFTWIVVFDAEKPGQEISPGNIGQLEIVVLSEPSVRSGSAVSASGNLQRNVGLDHAGDGWVCFLDDDTVLHPDLLKHIGPICLRNPMVNIIVDQSFSGGAIRCSASPQNIRCLGIDSGQAFLSRSLIGDKRWPLMNYDADWQFIAEVYRSDPSSFEFVNVPVSVYNYLR